MEKNLMPLLDFHELEKTLNETFRKYLEKKYENTYVKVGRQCEVATAVGVEFEGYSVLVEFEIQDGFLEEGIKHLKNNYSCFSIRTLDISWSNYKLLTRLYVTEEELKKYLD